MEEKEIIDALIKHKFRENTLKEKKLLRNARRRRMSKKKVKQKVLALGKDAEKAKSKLDQ